MNSLWLTLGAFFVVMEFLPQNLVMSYIFSCVCSSPDTITGIDLIDTSWANMIKLVPIICIVPCRRYLLHCLFPTPRVVITIFPYTEFWPSDILPRSGPLMSSPFEGWQLTDSTISNCLFVTDLIIICDWLLVTEIHFLKRIYPDPI
jgi:hypothetical protein